MDLISLSDFKALLKRKPHKKPTVESLSNAVSFLIPDKELRDELAKEKLSRISEEGDSDE